MKCKESYIGSKKECIEYLNGMLPKLFRGELQLEGEDVFVPSGEELEYKIKFEYDEEHKYGQVGIKIAWGEEPEDGEEEEEEEEEDEEEEEEFIPKGMRPKDYYL